MPLVTVAIPCLNERAYLERFLRCVLQQDYPTDRVEILVADGGSSDGSREILDDVAARDRRVRWIDNSSRVQAAGMNAILRRSRGEVIVRMDVHCEYSKDYLRRCVEALHRTGADNVGGAQRPRSINRFQEALCAVLQSPLGVGGARYRSPDQEGMVDTVFLGAFRRRVFETIGMYDPNAVTNEDAELNQRILAAGGKVYLSRDIRAFYYPRSDYVALANQYFRYGVGRARTIVRHGLPRERGRRVLRPLGPLALVMGGTAMLVMPGLRSLLPWAVGGYVVITGVEAVRVSIRSGAGAALIPLIWSQFPVIHLSHGLGAAYGLARALLRREHFEAERLPRLRHGRPFNLPQHVRRVHRGLHCERMLAHPVSGVG